MEVVAQVTVPKVDEIDSRDNSPRAGVYYQQADPDEDLKELDEILDKESSELKMWRVHCLNVFLVLFALLINMLRGSPKTPSIIHIKKCGSLDFCLLIAFIAFNVIVMLIAVRE